MTWGNGVEAKVECGWCLLVYVLFRTQRNVGPSNKSCGSLPASVFEYVSGKDEVDLCSSRK